MAVRFLRDGRREPSPRTAFVLGGGGNLGAIQVGMLQALLRRDIQPDVIVGCSVGAVNGAAIAADPSAEGAERLGAVWNAIDGADLFPTTGLSSLWALAKRGTALGRNDGLRRLVASSLQATKFEETVVPLHVVATSLRTGAERWFSTGPIVEPILASAALPAIFPPVEIDGELHVDGGVVDNVPISKAVSLGATRVYVCHVGNFDRPRAEPKRPVDVLLQSFSIARNHRFVSEAAQAWPGVDLVVLPGVDPGRIGRSDFRRSTELIRRGRDAAAAFLDAEVLREAR